MGDPIVRKTEIAVHEHVSERFGRNKIDRRARLLELAAGLFFAEECITHGNAKCAVGNRAQASLASHRNRWPIVRSAFYTQSRQAQFGVQPDTASELRRRASFGLQRMRTLRRIDQLDLTVAALDDIGIVGQERPRRENRRGRERAEHREPSQRATCPRTQRVPQGARGGSNSTVVHTAAWSE
jgi:hypothetical protein